MDSVNELVEKNLPGILWNGGTITIKDAFASHEGYWQCKASNMYGTSMSTYVKLERFTLGFYTGEEADKVTHHKPTIGQPFQVRHTITYFV